MLFIIANTVGFFEIMQKNSCVKKIPCNNESNYRQRQRAFIHLHFLLNIWNMRALKIRIYKIDGYGLLDLQLPIFDMRLLNLFFTLKSVNVLNTSALVIKIYGIKIGVLNQLVLSVKPLEYVHRLISMYFMTEFCKLETINAFELINLN